MTTYADTPRDRNIKDITAGEILLYGSSDGGTTWYPVAVDASGNLQMEIGAGSQIIGNVGITGTTQTILTEDINFSTAIDSTIIAAHATKKNKVVSITLTVGGETNLLLKHGATAYSGAMDFGGTSEPRGWTINFWPFPLETAVNEAFIISSSLAVQVSGFVQYFQET